MSEIVITEALAERAIDRIALRGTVDGREVTASCWLSAVENFYPPDAYEDVPEGDDTRAPGRHLKDGSKPRRMTEAERTRYFAGLLAEAAGSGLEDLTPRKATVTL